MDGRITLTAGRVRALQAAPVTKGLPPLRDAPPAGAREVYGQLLPNYPAPAISWVLSPSVRWYGPCEVPLDEVDTHDEDSWAAARQPGAVDRFAREIEAGTGHVNPVVMVRVHGQKARVIDGHHRFLACWRLGWPCKSYVGYVPRITAAMQETHSSQRFQGADPRNKAAAPREDPSRTAFLLARARNGAGRRRYLLQKRSDDSSHGGTWGLPGGSCHAGEDPWDAALREAGEEIGALPAGLEPCAVLTRDRDGETAWTFLADVPAMFGPGMDGATPEETAGWGWFRRRDVGGLRLHPAFRDLWEDTDWKHLPAAAAKSAQTPVLETTPDLLGPHGLWHTPSKKVPVKQKLPDYVEHIAHALMRNGMSEQHAIATAVNAIKRWAKGDLHWGRGHVTPEVQAASRRALAEWKKLRASHDG